MIQLLVSGIVLLMLSFGWIRPRRSKEQAQQAIYASLKEQGASQVRIAPAADAKDRASYVYEVRFCDPMGQEQCLICKVPTTEKEGYLYWQETPPMIAAQMAHTLASSKQEMDLAAVSEEQRRLIRKLRKENAQLKRQVASLSAQVVQGRSTYGEYLN